MNLSMLLLRGASNPTVKLDDKDEVNVRERLRRCFDAGVRRDLILPSRSGGFALSWTEGGRDHHVIVKHGVLAVSTPSGELELYEDVCNLGRSLCEGRLTPYEARHGACDVGEKAGVR